jgi:hypothetical protein
MMHEQTGHSEKNKCNTICNKFFMSRIVWLTGSGNNDNPKSISTFDWTLAI